MPAGELDIGALVKRATRKGDPNLCWYMQVPDGDAREYLTLIAAAERAVPRSVNRTEVWRTMMDELDYNVSIEAVKRHYRGECQCEQE